MGGHVEEGEEDVGNHLHEPKHPEVVDEVHQKVCTKFGDAMIRLGVPKGDLDEVGHEAR